MLTHGWHVVRSSNSWQLGGSGRIGTAWKHLLKQRKAAHEKTRLSPDSGGPTAHSTPLGVRPEGTAPPSGLAANSRPSDSRRHDHAVVGGGRLGSLARPRC